MTTKTWRTILLCATLALASLPLVGGTAPARAATAISSIATNADGHKYIQLGSTPFFPIIAQYRADYLLWNNGAWSTSLTTVDSYFQDAADMGYNTVSVPVVWDWIEPALSTYNWTNVDNFISTAQSDGLHLDLLWYGSDIAGGAIRAGGSLNCPDYVPTWVTGDQTDYQRHINSNSQVSEETPSNNCIYDAMSFTPGNTLTVETSAMTNLMNHIASVDTHDTVIGVQVNNETQINALICATSNEQDRSYDAATTTAYNNSGLGNSPQFARNQLADYQNTLAQAIKQSNYPVYTRMNYWGTGCGTTAAEVAGRAPNIDFVGDDPYTQNISTLRGLLSSTYNQLSIEENGAYNDTPTLLLTSLDAGALFYSTYQLVDNLSGSGMVSTSHTLNTAGTDTKPTLLQLEKDDQDLADHTPGYSIGYFHVLDENSSNTTNETLVGVPISYTTSSGGIGVGIVNSNDILLMGAQGSGSFTVTAGLPNSIDEGYFDSSRTWHSTGSAGYTNNNNGTFTVNVGPSDFIRLHYNSTVGSPWDDLSGYAGAGPAICSQGTNELDVFVANSWGVYQNTWNGSSWSNWVQLPSPPSTAIGVSCVSSGSGRIDVAIVGSNNATYHDYYSNGSWSNTWDDLSGYATAGPALCSQGANELDVFVANSYGVYQKTWNGSSWSASWTQLPSPPSASIGVSCVSWGSGRIDLAIVGSNNATYHEYYCSGSWSNTWDNLAGYAASSAICSQGANELDVLVENSTGVYQKTWNGSSWSSNWSQLPTTPSGQTAVSCVSWGSGRIDAAIIGNNNVTYHNYFSSGTWH